MLLGSAALVGSAHPVRAAPARTRFALAGVVRLDGLTPAPRMIPVTDPACRAAHPHGLPDERLLAGPGRELANVFVYLTTNVPAGEVPVPVAPITINQQGCRYAPHVFGIRVGQPLAIINSDPVLHNIHALARVGRPFNVGMPPRNQPWTVVRTFTAPEVMVHIRCDVHGWMNAWAGVLAHPWFAVSGPDGRFTLPPLPPGDYTLAAWHERCGSATRQVHIGSVPPPPVQFIFHAPPD